MTDLSYYLLVELDHKLGSPRHICRLDSPILPVYLSVKRKPFGPITCVIGEPYKLNFKVVRAVVTQKEKEFLEIQRRNIETVCRREFSMDDARLSQIIQLITLDNVARVNQKIAELVKRTEINGDGINDVCSYAFTVIAKELDYSFGMAGEPLEIDEMF